jgi:hypothetical protein
MLAVVKDLHKMVSSVGAGVGVVQRATRQKPALEVNQAVAQVS